MNNRIGKYLLNLVKKIINQVVNILIPKEKRVCFLEELGPTGLFENIPRADNFDFETNKIKAIFNYKTVLCRQAIWEIKYRANKKLIRDFSLLLYEFILEELDDLQTFENFQKPILIPIPSSKSREREKGFNQCILIARELIKIDNKRNGNNFTLLENYLVKKFDTPHQARISNRKKRLENLKNTFSVNETAMSKLGFGNCLGAISPTLSEKAFPKTQPANNYSFIIIDDVITTGATMAEAFRALKSAGISTTKIRGYALAH